MSAPSRERCRTRTAEELAALPAHMRVPEVCEDDVARYLLVTRIGTAPADTAELVRGGAKGDRPLFVHVERTPGAGRHHLAVRLLRLESDGAEEVLARLDTTVVLEPGRVRLVTLDESGRLTAR